MNEIIIPVDEVEKDFQSFLNIEGNTRIFFSGQFGIGKTYFLKNFFKENVGEYDVYHLFPVQYQIHGNDDVINLLKYDLLVELSEKDKNIFAEKTAEGIKDSSFLFYSWIKENYPVNQTLQSILSAGEFLSGLSPDPIIGLLGKLGRPLKNLLKLDEEFQEFKSEYKSGERRLVERYEETIRTKVDLETDYISSLVKDKIAKNKKNKKSVLVLDDMDRIDPEHIFRMLNVLSTHFEREQENKFGFDFVIFVADYSNLKHIFHHRYGAKTDFSGYVDKFFTITPYYFDNKKAVIARVDEIVRKIKNEDPALNRAIGESGFIKIFLEHIFTRVVDAEIVNLRQLLKATNFQLIELKKGGYNSDPFADNFQKIFDIAIKIAIHSFSGLDSFVEKLEAVKIQRGEEDKVGFNPPFYRYIVAMLKSRDVIIPDDEPFNGYVRANGQEYHVVIENRNRPKSFDVEFGSEKNKEMDLFYDLLIQYVKDRKHIKDSSYDYDD